jgi:uncharacterized repeat protein (TIGR01451 family)
MRKQAVLVLIGIFIVLAVTGRLDVRHVLASAQGDTDNRAESAQEQSIPDSGSSAFLTEPNSGEPVELALSYLRQNSSRLDMEPADLDDVLVKNQYVTQHNGVTHIYLRQRYQGIELFNGDINANVSSRGELISVGNRFVGNLASYVNTTTPEISADAAVALAAQQMHWNLTAPLQVIEDRGGPARELLLSGAGISSQSIPVKLLYVRLGEGEVRLTWNVRIHELDGSNVWNLAIDAVTGTVLLKQDMIIHEASGVAAQAAHAQKAPVVEAATAKPATAPQQNESPLASPSYRVFALPLEHPNDGPGLPDSQTRVQGVEDPLASPFGWHDIDALNGHEFNDTRGNNVSTQEDRNDDDMDGFRPTGMDPAQFDFDYPFDPSLDPTEGDNPATAVVNLFYVSNVMHDIAYQYGFDEVSGNYQQNNYDRGGLGGDSVQADAQDGFDFGVVDNAQWFISEEGVPPRMEMFIFDFTVPFRDSSLDNGIIIHEYGHGISTRLVGGPANPLCLFNPESMGEGWSDWFTLALTAKPGDTGAEARGMGTYVLGQPSDGPGIRRVPYSTDMSIDPQTYDWLKRSSEVHDVGEVWATMLWEAYWALVDEHGYDPDIYTGTGGNNLALRLVMDGMKFTVCDPGFVDARDAILIADEVNNGGANQCTLWAAFAKRGLGFSATQGSPFDPFDGSEAFDLPPSCRDDLSVDKTTSTPEVEAGKVLTYEIAVNNYTSQTLTGLTLTDPIPANTTYVPGSASDGGNEVGGVITWQLPDLNPDEGVTRTFAVTVDRTFPDAEEIFFDDMESGGGNWEATGLWHLEDDTEPCGNSFSPTHSWYYGQAPDCLYTDDSVGQLTTVQPIALPNGRILLSFMSWQDFEICCDQGQVLVSTDGTNYLPVLFTGSSNGTWQDLSVDLSAFAGQSIWLRFLFQSDFSVVFRGWYVDDVRISVEPSVNNTATLTSNEGETASDSTITPVLKLPDIEVNPTSLEETVAIGAQTVSTLTISNVGTAPLNFIILPLSNSPVETSTTALAAVPPSAAQVPGSPPAQERRATYAGEYAAARQERSIEPRMATLTSALSANVLLLAAADVTQIQTILESFPELGAIDYFDARVAVPTVGDLMAYDTVVVISNESFADPAATGDVLADYVDSNGTVVQTVPTFFDPFGNGWGLAGRWVTDGYSPLIGTGDWFADASLGSFDASHPIMQGVDAATDFFRQIVDLAPGANLVASWTDDEFVATKGRVVALNTFISDGNAWTGDIDLIVYNSIVWLQTQRGEPVTWLSVNPVSGTVPSDATQTVEVTFDASVPEVHTGDLSARLLVLSNDPDEPIVEVPVTMHVFGPELSITSDTPSWFGRPAEVAVNFTSAGFDIAATTFSVDFDESCLQFDPTDSDANGVPDAITFATPASLQAMVTADLGDNDGELDFFIADTSLPLETFADGVLATIRFTTSCLPPADESLLVEVGFSNDPAASFSDPNGVSIQASTNPGIVEVSPGTPGDCNNDGVVDSADTISCSLELLDGDGSFWLDAGGGTFPGSPQGCDSNQDEVIDAADMICTVLIIFQGQGACSAASANDVAVAAGSSAAVLEVPDAITVQPGSNVSVPVNFTGNGNEIAATVFVMTFDAARLQVDPTDSNGDGIPDAVNLHVPSRFAKSVIVDNQGSIQIALSDIALPLTTLQDGPLATITFNTAATADGQPAAIGFSEEYAASAGSTNGASVPVIADGGSVLVTNESPESESPASELPEEEFPVDEVPEVPHSSTYYLPVVTN